MVRPLFDLGDQIQDFRRTIRPGLVGRLGQVEPILARRAANAVWDWLTEVIEDTLKTTEIKSRSGELRRQLMHGRRVTGRASLRTMKARVWTQPWIFAHEFGATIEPKQKFLAVPFAYGVHPDGRAKFRSPLSWKRYGSFVLTHKDGRKFIVYKSGKELKYLYILVDSVDIPERLGLNRMADSKLGELLSTLGEIYISQMFLSGVDITRLPGFRV